MFRHSRIERNKNSTNFSTTSKHGSFGWKKWVERSGVIIAIEFCGYPWQTRTIWSAHPTAEYLSGICLMHKQFPCRRRHRQLPIITHLRSRGWTIVVSREQTRFSSPFQTVGEDREPTSRRDFPPRGRKILYVVENDESKGRNGKREKERGKKNEDEDGGGSCTIAFVTVASREYRRQYILGQVGGYTQGRKWEILGRKARIYNEVWLAFDCGSIRNGRDFVLSDF